MEAKVTGTVDANLELLPRRSQIQVFVCGAAAIVFALIGCLFLWYEKANWWVPFLVFAIFLVAGMICYFASYQSSEMHNASATEVTISNQRIKVVADPRLPGHTDLFKSFATVFTALSNQKPLPVADALVDEKGNLISGSETDARDAVDSANKEAAHLVSETLSLFSEFSTSELSTAAVKPVGMQTATSPVSRVGNNRA